MPIIQCKCISNALDVIENNIILVKKNDSGIMEHNNDIDYSDNVDESEVIFIFEAPKRVNKILFMSIRIIFSMKCKIHSYEQLVCTIYI